MQLSKGDNKDINLANETKGVNHERETKYKVTDGRPEEHDAKKKGGDRDEKEKRFKVVDVLDAVGSGCHGHVFSLYSDASSRGRQLFQPKRHSGR